MPPEIQYKLSIPQHIQTKPETPFVTGLNTTSDTTTKSTKIKRYSIEELFFTVSNVVQALRKNIWPNPKFNSSGTQAEVLVKQIKSYNNTNTTTKHQAFLSMIVWKPTTKDTRNSSNDAMVELVNDVIADKNVVTKIMDNSTGLHCIELNVFAKRHLAYWLLPLCKWLVFRPLIRPRLVPVV